MLLLSAFDFLKLSLTDIVDIVLVALVILFVFKWLRDSAMTNIFVILIGILVLRIVASAFGMRMMTALLQSLIDIGVVALIIIFQPEIRHSLMRMGNGTGIGRKSASWISRIFGDKAEGVGVEAVKEITEACRNMSQEKTGALIVLPHNTSLEHIIETGDRIDAAINRRLIRNIFFKNSPLHDGAMIIAGGRIVAARCTLPITQRTDIPPSYGMRHKAAIGISEESDADVIVVSEETGHILFINAEKGIIPIESLTYLKNLLSPKQEEKS